MVSKFFFIFFVSIFCCIPHAVIAEGMQSGSLLIGKQGGNGFLSRVGDSDQQIAFHSRFDSLLDVKNTLADEEDNSNDFREEFLKAGSYFSKDEKNSLSFKVEVSGTTSPTIVFEPAPDFCGAKTDNPLKKNSFLFECKNTTDECEGYSISTSEKGFALKRISPTSFIFKTATRNYLLGKSRGIDWTVVKSYHATKTPSQTLCMELKQIMTSDLKSDCRACGGKDSNMTFEYEENPWTNTQPTVLKKYNCEVKTKAFCPY